MPYFLVFGIIIKASKKKGAPAVLIAALVAVSRLYLFVHWPTDVIGGMITGVFSAKIGYKITNPFSGLFKKKKKKRR